MILKVIMIKMVMMMYEKIMMMIRYYVHDDDEDVDDIGVALLVHIKQLLQRLLPSSAAATTHLAEH